jgi:ABC-2 type transport system ATP-binding protein
MIRVEDVTKLYGPVHALDHVTFEVADRQVLGFLGPNGAGKSTAMKIITTYIAPSQGRVTVDDLDVSKFPIEVRRKIGYLPETNPLYPDMRTDDYLRFCGEARGLSGAALRERFHWVVEACGIQSVLKKNIHELSKGFKQRTGLAQALIHDPQILILDEPTSGLDPLQIIEIRRLVQELARSKTIVFSTHILQEVSATTDRIIIINEGRIIADGYISDLKNEAAGVTHVRATMSASRAAVEREVQQLAGLSGWSIVGEADNAVTVDLKSPLGSDLRRKVGELAARHNWPVLELTVPALSLEDAFIELIKKSDTARKHEKGSRAREVVRA